MYGSNCVLISQIFNTVPPTNIIYLPPQFNSSPSVMVKITTLDGCVKTEIIDCIYITPTQTPSNTPTPTNTQTQTPTNTPTPTITPTNTMTPTPTPTTPETLGYCYTYTYPTVTTFPPELYIRYYNSSNVAVTVQMTFLPASDNGDGSTTTFVCQYYGAAPLCITDNGVDPPIPVNCGIVYGITWNTIFDTCTSNFDCNPIIP